MYQDCAGKKAYGFLVPGQRKMLIWKLKAVMRLERAQVIGGGGVVVLLTRQKYSESAALGTGVYPARLIVWSCWLIFIVNPSSVLLILSYVT